MIERTATSEQHSRACVILLVTFCNVCINCLYILCVLLSSLVFRKQLRRSKKATDMFGCAGLQIFIKQRSVCQLMQLQN